MTGHRKRWVVRRNRARRRFSPCLYRINIRWIRQAAKAMRKSVMRSDLPCISVGDQLRLYIMI